MYYFFCSDTLLATKQGTEQGIEQKKTEATDEKQPDVTDSMKTVDLASQGTSLDKQGPLPSVLQEDEKQPDVTESMKAVAAESQGSSPDKLCPLPSGKQEEDKEPDISVTPKEDTEQADPVNVPTELTPSTPQSGSR